MDLFWALRGGAGGTFGVVTRMVHKAHEEVSSNYFSYSGVILFNDLACRLFGTDCKSDMLTTFFEFVHYTEEN